MSYRCPTCTMRFNKKEHAKCGRCTAPKPEVQGSLVIVTGEFWPKTSAQPAEETVTMERPANE